MANSNRVTLEELAGAITQELTVYAKDVQEAVNKRGRKAIKDVERRTKDTAPFNARAYHQHYADLIATKTEKGRTGDEKHVWYVKPPGHRLTHLLVKGHETRDGERTAPSPFLQNALDAVLPDYEREVEEAVKNGK
jgi:hypothetical protein